jgi:hypothetical protein
MYGYRANIVWVSFEGGDFLGGIVVVHAQLEIIGTCTHAINSNVSLEESTKDLPATIQFFLAMNRPARTGTSVSSKVFTIDCETNDHM